MGSEMCIRDRNNEILGDKDRIRIEDGAIVTIGATTLILRSGTSNELE